MKKCKCRYKDVSEMVEDADFAKYFDIYLKERQLVKQLMIARARKGLSVEDMAKRMECSLKHIEKMECGRDSDLRMEDIADYLKALNNV